MPTRCTFEPWPVSLIAKPPGSSSEAICAQVGLVVLARARVEDRAAEEAELDPALDQQREVAVAERLEGRDRRRPPGRGRRTREGSPATARRSRPVPAPTPSPAPGTPSSAAARKGGGTAAAREPPARAHGRSRSHRRGSGAARRGRTPRPPRLFPSRSSPRIHDRRLIYRVRRRIPGAASTYPPRPLVERRRGLAEAAFDREDDRAAGTGVEHSARPGGGLRRISARAAGSSPGTRSRAAP